MLGSREKREMRLSFGSVLRAAAVVSSAALLAVGIAAPASALPVTPQRLAGHDRYETSAEVTKHLYSAASTLFIASGANYPDALAGAPAASIADAPLLLTGESLADPVRAQLTRLDPEHVVILGGVGTVSAAVEAELGGFAAEVSRVAGATRYETAAEVSAAAFPDGAETVFIASGENYADALAGAPAAATKAAPVLLVPPDRIPEAVAAELARLAPDDIVVLGGSGSVSEAIAGELGSIASVSRLAGADRYATSVAISTTFPGAGGTVVIASGEGFPDALSIAAAAGELSAPLLLTQKSTVPSVVADRYRQLDPARTIVAGGSSAIADNVIAFLGDPSKPIASEPAQNALDKAAQIPVSSTKAAGYDRDSFGDWADADGCNTRHKILARDLTNVTYSSGCKVKSGTLHDPYSGQTVELSTTSSGSTVEIDHLVPVSVAWYYGASTWTDARRAEFYNDHEVLQATASDVNQSKSNKTISQWQPTNEAYVCTYTIRYVDSVSKWGLSWSAEDAAWVQQKLPTC